MTSPPILPADWLPHTGPMLMLSEVLRHDEQSIECISIIRDDNPLLEHALFPVSGGIELFAQAVGVLFGLRRAASQSRVDTRPGAVVQLKSFALEVASIPVGSGLTISANYITGNDDVVMMEGDVIFQDSVIFKGSLMIALFTEEKA